MACVTFGIDFRGPNKCQAIHKPIHSLNGGANIHLALRPHITCSGWMAVTMTVAYKAKRMSLPQLRSQATNRWHTSCRKSPYHPSGFPSFFNATGSFHNHFPRLLILSDTQNLKPIIPWLLLLHFRPFLVPCTFPTRSRHVGWSLSKPCRRKPRETKVYLFSNS